MECGPNKRDVPICDLWTMLIDLKKAKLNWFLDLKDGGNDCSEALLVEGCWNTTPNNLILVEYFVDSLNVEDSISF